MKQTEAEKFAEWLLKNNWQNKDNNKWYNSVGWGVTQTTTQLYKIFINRKEAVGCSAKNNGA